MTNYLRWFLQVASITVPILLIGLLCALILRRLRTARGTVLPPLSVGNALLDLALAGDVFVTLLLTLVSRPVLVSVQLHLFASWREAWNAWSPHLFEQLFLNIAVFVPFGVLLTGRFAQLRRLWAVGGISLGFSLTIEVLQLIFRRGVFDVDDLFCNTLGGLLGGAVICLILRLREHKPGRALLASLPLLVSASACAAFFGAYALRPYGNLAIAPSHTYSMRGVSVTVNMTLADTPDIASVFTEQSYSETEAADAADRILAALGLTADSAEIEHFSEQTTFSYSDDHVYLNYDRAGGSWYLVHQKDGTHPAPTIGTPEKLIDWLSAFGLTLTDAEVTYAGNHIWYVTPAAEGNAPTGKITCTFYEDGAWSIDASIPVLQEVGREAILTPAEAAEAICSGRFRWYDADAGDFNTLILTDLTLIYRIDTKGFWVPVWRAAVTVDGKETSLLIPALH